MTDELHEVSRSTQSPSGETRFITKQPAGESLARVFLGASVQNGAGETIGDVHDIMFDRDGRITTVLLGVGGFIGLGEKIVAVPFSNISVTACLSP